MDILLTVLTGAAFVMLVCFLPYKAGYKDGYEDGMKKTNKKDD